MLIDARKLWETGGYSEDNDFDRSMARIRKHAKHRGINPELIITEFFIELSSDPKKYRTEGNICTCSCAIRNSGTNAIHTMFRRIDDAASGDAKVESEVFAEKLNKMILAHMEADNRAYLAENEPKADSTRIYWELALLVATMVAAGVYYARVYGLI